MIFVYRCRRELLYLLECHDVVVVVGETGCGKSTQLPQFVNRKEKKKSFLNFNVITNELDHFLLLSMNLLSFEISYMRQDGVLVVVWWA